MNETNLVESPSNEILSLGIIKGKDVKSGYTLKSWYDNNSVAICYEGKVYRMHITTIIHMMQGFEFKLSKKRVHNYLELNVGVIDCQTELLTAIKTAVGIIKDSYGEDDIDIESDCQAVNVLVRALKKVESEG